MIGQDLSGSTVLDAFGGTGLLAAEAWSRGADVTVVERNRRQAQTIRDTAKRLGAQWTVACGDSVAMAAALGMFDFVLADPPYALVTESLVANLSTCVGGTLVLEADGRVALPDVVGDLSRLRRKRYGNTSIHVYVR